MTRKLHPDNNSRLRIRAPAIIDAAMYLDSLQATGIRVSVTIQVGDVKLVGATFEKAVERVKEWRGG